MASGKNKSTTQALFLARRALDLGEQGNIPTFLLMLDWEKAFDKINHERLIKALGRLNIPERMVNSPALAQVLSL